MIKEITIENFKCFKERFTLKLNPGVNILVGDNEAGKSTILEAVHLALCGVLNGKYLKNELSQYLFNNETVAEYVASMATAKPLSPPSIVIELYLNGEPYPELLGNANSKKSGFCGLTLKICFNTKYQAEYEALVKLKEITTVPIEYYDIEWSSFARGALTTKSVPIKSALIDSSSSRHQNGSDVYISRIVKEFLSTEDVVALSQAHRKMRDGFMAEKSVSDINSRISKAAAISSKQVNLSVDMGTKNAWENSLMTYLDDVPFHYIGKGEQCVVKTKLALSHKKAKDACIILLEEPENHLSHSKLNQLLNEIKKNIGDKQIIVSTHSSFVANKLGLDTLIFLNDSRTLMMKDLDGGTRNFFEKLAGYDTLRLILCRRAILVEGDSDELVVQKAYLKKHGRLPIEDGVDVISVGTSFLRFLEIAARINKPVVVVTDNDGDVSAVNSKYDEYLKPSAVTKDFITISFDSTIDAGELKIGKKDYNYNTLEPKLLKANSLSKLNTVFRTSFTSEDELRKHMKANKTECALKIFDTTEEIVFPEYISNAI